VPVENHVKGLALERKALSPGDTVRLVTSALSAPSIHVVTCYGVSRNTRRFYTDDGWAELG
jgi:uronate dehydrogenase